MLTEEQSKIKAELLGALNENSKVKLLGSAGVGKTYLVASLIEEILAKPGYKNVLCAAPTHKAVAVLKSKVDNPRVKFGTIHQALKLKRKIDPKNGNISFVPDTNPKNNDLLTGCTHLFVDESSMIESSILERLELAGDQKKFKIIFIGDDKQINPVGEPTVSKIFEREYPTFRLETIVRQGAGNPIIDLSRNIESIGVNKDACRIEGKGYLYTNDYAKIISTLAHVNGSNHLKYLAYTNNEVNKVNRDVRRAIYGSPKKIELGERLVFNAPYGENYHNNEEIEVNHVIETAKKFKINVGVNPLNNQTEYEEHTLKVYVINSVQVAEPVFQEENSWDFTETEKGRDGGIMVIHEDSEEELKKLEKKLRTLSIQGLVPWTYTIPFSEQFADLNYCHALTVHKS